ncbi:hypothetical protein GGR52DRAFT_575422 [Hypoxylon sp. FL1284]|nr:hypothetical protein GGR52DRAFT_575422 [Hypoxylon sp. FL1284]
MEARREDAAEVARSTSCSQSYIAPSALGPSQQTTLSARRWGFGRSQNRDSARSQDLESRAPIRNSVTYPSDSTFEATIVKGTAQMGQRYRNKTQLVDLGRPERRKESSETRVPESSHSVAETKSLSPSEDSLEDQVSNHRVATEMYHNAIARMGRTIPPKTYPPSSVASQPIKLQTPVPTPTHHRACAIRNLFRRAHQPSRARSSLEERVGSLEAGFASIVLLSPANPRTVDRERI